MVFLTFKREIKQVLQFIPCQMNNADFFLRIPDQMFYKFQYL